MANVGEGILSGMSKFRIAGLPLGSAVVGGLVAGAGAGIAEVVSGFVPGIPTWATKGMAAWGTISFAGRFIGKEAAELGGLFLIFDAITDVFDVKGMVRNFIVGFGSNITGGGAAQAVNAGANAGGDYYSGLGG